MVSPINKRKLTVLLLISALLTSAFSAFAKSDVLASPAQPMYPDAASAENLTSNSTVPGAVQLWNFSDGGISSPLLVSGGFLYAFTEYNHGYDDTLYCLNASNGNTIWSHAFQGHVGSALTLSNGFLYFGSYDVLYAFNASSGVSIWNCTVGTIRSPGALVVDEGYIYVGSYNYSITGNTHGYVYCINATTGAKIWNFATECVMGSPVLSGGKIYVCGQVDESSTTYCLDAATGLKLWSYTAQLALGWTPVAVGNSVYLSYNTNNVSTGSPYTSSVCCFDAETGVQK